MATMSEVMNAKTVKDIIRLGGVKIKPEPELPPQANSKEKGKFVDCFVCGPVLDDGSQVLWVPDKKKAQFKRFVEIADTLQKDHGVCICLHTTAEEFYSMVTNPKISGTVRDIITMAQLLAPNPLAQQDFFGRDGVGGRILKTIRVRDGYAVVRIGRTHCRVKIEA